MFFGSTTDWWGHPLTSLSEEPDAEQSVGHGGKMDGVLSGGCGERKVTTVGREHLNYLKMAEGGGSVRV